eukprot:1048446-Pelagomonas_calceolata.AAC.2
MDVFPVPLGISCGALPSDALEHRGTYLKMPSTLLVPSPTVHTCPAAYAHVHSKTIHNRNQHPERAAHGPVSP